jgi:hypothetical protein
MAIGVIFSFPGATSEQYDEVSRGLNSGQLLWLLAGWPGGGFPMSPARHPTVSLGCTASAPSPVN